MVFLIAGIIVLLLTSVFHSYCAFSLKASLVLRPMVFHSHTTILQIGWIAFFLIGLALLFVYHWIAGLVGAFVYWLLLPLVIQPIVNKHMLPSWDDLPENIKAHLLNNGYNKHNYLTGNWWKK